LSQNIFTEEDARQRLDADVAKAHDLYNRRLARLRDANARHLAGPGKSNTGKDWSRYETAFRLRNEGMKLKDVANHLGVSVTRASQMVETHKRRAALSKNPDSPDSALAFRTQTILRNELGRTDYSKSDVANLSISALKKASGCGPTTINDIRLWLREGGLDLKL